MSASAVRKFTGAANADAPTLEQLFNALPNPVLVLGPDDQIVIVNAASEHFFHASSTLLKRQRIGDIAAFASPLLALVEQVRRTRASVNEYGVNIATPKIGGDKLVDIFGAPLADTPDHVVLILQQRTMAQMIERQLTHRAAARSVSGMAATLAHEIKNPLSGIRGAAQLLESELDDEGRALTRLIRDETDRICGLVDRMEVFGEERPVPKTPINIHSVLDHVKRLAQSGFASHISIEENYDPSLPQIAGDRDRLVQAVLNLVKNAAEAIGPDRNDGRIELTTAFRPGVRLTLPGARSRVSLPLLIAIEDNGPGIPEELRAHLFDPFVTSKPRGGGLGLALVAKIIGDHGGIIECDSQQRRTTFRMLMPMQSNVPEPDREVQY
ncbi:MAG: ATP-binding protein [Hyphomicrobiaceae bacterium]